MKIRDLMTGGILAALLAAMAAPSAHATKPDPYEDDNGDLLLGFYKASSTYEYFVDLGDLGLTNPSQSFTLLNTTSNLANDLSLAFGGTWASQSIYYGVIGTAPDNNYTGYNLYISQPSPDVFEGQGDQGQARTDINNIGSILTSGTAQLAGQESGGLVENASTAGGWTAEIDPANNAFAGTGVGALYGGSGGDGGISALITNSLPLAFVQDVNLQNSTVTGTFSLASNGDLTYTAAGAVPEPSTYAAIGLGAVALLIFGRRRRSLA